MATRVTFKLAGTAELLARLQEAKQQAPGAAAAAVYVEAITLARRTKPDVPVDTSLLVNSEYVTLPSPRDANPKAEVGFSAPYALPVHERDEAKHSVGQAHFLLKNFLAIQNGYARRVLARMLLYVKQGVTVPSPDSAIPTEPMQADALLKKVASHLKRDKGRTKAQRSAALGKARAALARPVRTKA